MVIQEGGNQIKSWRNPTSWQSNAGYSRERNQKAIVRRGSRSRAERGFDRRVAPGGASPRPVIQLYPLIFYLYIFPVEFYFVHYVFLQAAVLVLYSLSLYVCIITVFFTS